MRLLRLELENFRQYEKAIVDFQPGITAIIGPNGAGKTTLLEAVAWSLYGANAKRGDNLALRWMWSTGRAKVRVSLSFILGDRQFRAIRTTDGAEIRDITDGEPGIALANGLSETTRCAERMLGMTLQQFSTSFYAQQKELQFMSYAPEKRREEISKMLGLERVTVALKDAKEELKDLDNTLKGLREGMGDPAVLKQVLKDRNFDVRRIKDELKAVLDTKTKTEKALQEYTPIRQKADVDERKHQFLTQQLQSAESVLKLLNEQLESANQDIKSIAEAEIKLKGLEENIKRYLETEKLVRAQEDLQRHENKRVEIKTELSAAQLALTEGKKEAEGLKDAENEFQIATVKLAESDKKFEDLREERDKILKVLNERKGIAIGRQDVLNNEYKATVERFDQLHKLGETGVCPTCERELGEHFDTVVVKYKNDLARIESELEKVKELLQEIEKEPIELKQLKGEGARVKGLKEAAQAEVLTASTRKSHYDKLLNQLGVYERQIESSSRKLEALPTGFDGEKLELARKERDSLRADYDQSVSLKSTLEGRKKAELQARELATKITTEQATKDQATNELETLAFDRDAYEHTLAELIKRQEVMVEAQRKHSILETQLTGAETALVHAQEVWTECEQKLEKLAQTQKAHRQTSDVAIALQEMRQEINARMRPQLADYASDYLNRLTAGRYSEIEIDEAFNFTLKDDDVSKLVVSGGEEDVINLSLRLALARMITERAGQPFSLLILDEVFGSLDDERRQNLLNLFDTLRSWFEQIFIISHIESINETVDNTLWVRYDSETRKASLSEQTIASFSGDILDQMIEGSNEGSILTQPGLFLDNED